MYFYININEKIKKSSFNPKKQSKKKYMKKLICKLIGHKTKYGPTGFLITPTKTCLRCGKKWEIIYAPSGWDFYKWREIL